MLCKYFVNKVSWDIPCSWLLYWCCRKAALLQVIYSGKRQRSGEQCSHRRPWHLGQHHAPAEESHTEPTPPAGEAQSFNHWTDGEVLSYTFKTLKRSSINPYYLPGLISFYFFQTHSLIQFQYSALHIHLALTWSPIYLKTLLLPTKFYSSEK